MNTLTERTDMWLLRRGKHEPDLSDPETAWGRCIIEAERLRDYLGAERTSLIRITGHNYPGREHWAVIALDEDAPEDSLVIDVTLRQFIADAPLPWTGTLVEWYDQILDGINDYIDVAVHDDPQEPATFTDFYDREDVEPGNITYPWQKDPKPEDQDRFDELAAEQHGIVTSLAEQGNQDDAPEPEEAGDESEPSEEPESKPGLLDRLMGRS